MKDHLVGQLTSGFGSSSSGSRLGGSSSGFGSSSSFGSNSGHGTASSFGNRNRGSTFGSSSSSSSSGGRGLLGAGLAGGVLGGAAGGAGGGLASRISHAFKPNRSPHHQLPHVPTFAGMGQTSISHSQSRRKALEATFSAEKSLVLRWGKIPWPSP